MSVPKFRKKPVVVEAIQFNSFTDYLAVCGWMRMEGDDPYRLVTYSEPDMFVNTREGRMQASPGDWIIRGEAGEFYPCKDAIFRQTYEPVA